MKREEKLFAGTVVKPQGIRGELRVMPETDSPQDWKTVRTAELRRGGSSLGIRRVLSSRGANGMAIIRLENVEDRNAAEALRGVELWVPREELAKEGKVFLTDIPGCVVVDETGCVYGEAAEVEQYPANDVLVIRGDRGMLSIPMVKTVIRSIDSDTNRVYVYKEGMEASAVYED